jgi:hypothetical protein
MKFNEDNPGSCLITLKEETMKKYWWILVFGLAILFAGIFALATHSNGIAAAPSGSISGVVWQDYCARDCDAGSSLKRGNGIVNPAERRLPNIKVMLSKGKCGENRTAVTKKTNSKGFYRFANLKNGFYCVSVTSRQSNTAFKKPGYWSRPAVSGSNSVAKYTIKITGPTEFVNTSFGWNYR